MTNWLTRERRSRNTVNIRSKRVRRSEFAFLLPQTFLPSLRNFLSKRVMRNWFV